MNGQIFIIAINSYLLTNNTTDNEKGYPFLQTSISSNLSKSGPHNFAIRTKLTNNYKKNANFVID